MRRSATGRLRIGRDVRRAPERLSRERLRASVDSGRLSHGGDDAKAGGWTCGAAGGQAGNQTEWQADEMMEGWMNGQANGRMYRRTNGRTKERKD